MVKFIKNNVIKILVGVLALAVFTGVLGFVKSGKTVKAAALLWDSVSSVNYVFANDSTVQITVEFLDSEWTVDDIISVNVWKDTGTKIPIVYSTVTKASGAVTVISTNTIRVVFDGGFSFVNDLVLSAPYNFTLFPVGSDGSFIGSGHGDCYIIPFMFEGAFYLPSIPTKPHYDFTGWYWDEPCTIPYAGEPIYENTVLYAGWKLKQYTVTFNTNGGTAVSSITQNALTAFTPSTASTMAGGSFAGWYTDSALTTPYVNGTQLTGNMTLYAKWDAGLLVVTFMVDGSVYAEVDVPYGTVLSVAVTVAQGDTVVMTAFYADPQMSTPVSVNTVLMSDMTVYAEIEVLDTGIWFGRNWLYLTIGGGLLIALIVMGGLLGTGKVDGLYAGRKK